MRSEKVVYFTEKEKEFVNLLIEIGTRKNVAKVLVFFTSTPEATSHEIEIGTDLRQPEVSLVMCYLMEQGWITCRESKTENMGRPIKILWSWQNPSLVLWIKSRKGRRKRRLASSAKIQKLRDYLH